MFNLDKKSAAPLLSLHSWSGVLLGLLLYAVVFTGAVAVFSEEIGIWSNGGKHNHALASADINNIVSSLSTQVEPKWHEEIGISEGNRGSLWLFFHTHQENSKGELDDYGKEFMVNPENGEIIRERIGYGSELFNSDPETALSRFLVNIHTELYLPRPWGLLLTGILGLAMLVAAISGFMMHRHLFADIFTLRKRRDGKTLARDAHTVAGTWGLPFAFILAFTGSFFSFAGAFGLPAMAMVAFGGDQEAMIRALVAAPKSERDNPSDSANLNAMIAESIERTGSTPNFVTISHYNREDARMMVFHPPADGGLEPKQSEFNAATGTFLQFKPQLGNTPSAGSAAFALIMPLHFGSFAGVASKLVWLALGFASCYVTFSGLMLFATRKQKQQQWRYFPRLCCWVGYGLPIASITSAMAYFLSLSIGTNANIWVPWSFLIAAIVVSGITWIAKDQRQLTITLLSLTAVGCLLLPFIRLLSVGPNWAKAISVSANSVLMVDLLLFTAAFYSFYALKKLQNSAQTNIDLKTEAVVK